MSLSHWPDFPAKWRMITSRKYKHCTVHIFSVSMYNTTEKTD